MNSTKTIRNKNIHILLVHFQWLLQNLRGLCRQNIKCVNKLWSCTCSPQLHINYTILSVSIVFTRNLITFAILHENTRCFVKMKAYVIRYIIKLSKLKNYFYFDQRELTQSTYAPKPFRVFRVYQWLLVYNVLYNSNIL